MHPLNKNEYYLKGNKQKEHDLQPRSPYPAKLSIKSTERRLRRLASHTLFSQKATQTALHLSKRQRNKKDDIREHRNGNIHIGERQKPALVPTPGSQQTTVFPAGRASSPDRSRESPEKIKLIEHLIT